jgi:hypothetical protein
MIPSQIGFISPEHLNYLIRKLVMPKVGEPPILDADIASRETLEYASAALKQWSGASSPSFVGSPDRKARGGRAKYTARQLFDEQLKIYIANPNSLPTVFIDMLRTLNSLWQLKKSKSSVSAQVGDLVNGLVEKIQKVISDVTVKLPQSKILSQIAQFVYRSTDVDYARDVIDGGLISREEIAENLGFSV